MCSSPIRCGPDLASVRGGTPLIQSTHIPLLAGAGVETDTPLSLTGGMGSGSASGSGADDIGSKFVIMNDANSFVPDTESCSPMSTKKKFASVAGTGAFLQSLDMCPIC